LQTAYEPCSSNEFSGSCCSRLGAPVGLGGKHANEEVSLRSKPLSEPCSSNEFSGSCCSRLGAPVGLGGKHANQALSLAPNRLRGLWVGSDDAIIAGMVWNCCMQVAGAEIEE